MLLAMIPVVEVSTFGYYACPFTHQRNSPFTLAGSKGIHVLWTHSSILSSYLCQKLKWALLTEKCLTSISLKLFTFTTSSDHCIPMPVIKLSTIVPLGVRGHEVSLLLFKTLLIFMIVTILWLVGTFYISFPQLQHAEAPDLPGMFLYWGSEEMLLLFGVNRKPNSCPGLWLAETF